MGLFPLLLPKCAVGVRKEEWGVDGEMKGDEDGLTGPGKKRKYRQEFNRCIKLLIHLLPSFTIVNLRNNVRVGHFKNINNDKL